MKIKYSFVLIAVMALTLIVTGVLAASVTPDEVPNLKTGDAAHYCVTTLGYDFGLKVDAWGGPGGYSEKDDFYDEGYDSAGKLHEDVDNTIYLKSVSRFSFNWESSPYAIGAVVVQGGWMDNIFTYYLPDDTDPTLYYADNGLYPYDSPDTNKREAISHVSFCWNLYSDDDPDPTCYQEETAWASGLPYVDQGNWAMYVPYVGDELIVDLVAGQNDIIGTVTFSEAYEGKVDITISLIDGWIFYYDLADIIEDDNIKIQDYESTPPVENPAIGHFDWKAVAPIGSNEYTITVDENNYYGVHIDVAHEIACPIE